MARKKVSETVTENLFREFYGADTFIEKSAIPSAYGFTSKKGTSYSGYPDFFCDCGDYCIVVEAKATNHAAAQEEVQYYMINNKIHKDTEYALDTEAIVYAVSASGSLGRSHYVNGKFIASNLCLVLTSKHDPKYPIDLKFYNCYFASIRKQIVSDLADGTSKLTISPDMFKDYYIDYIPYKEQQAFVKTKLKDFLTLQEKYKKAQEQLSQDIAALSD